MFLAHRRHQCQAWHRRWWTPPIKKHKVVRKQKAFCKKKKNNNTNVEEVAWTIRTSWMVSKWETTDTW